MCRAAGAGEDPQKESTGLSMSDRRRMMLDRLREMKNAAQEFNRLCLSNDGTKCFRCPVYDVRLCCSSIDEIANMEISEV